MSALNVILYLLNSFGKFLWSVSKDLFLALTVSEIWEGQKFSKFVFIVLKVLLNGFKV